ncbi:MAG TPA: redoxin domain-containing protein, partial [Myxococcota bacterium]|nr:redoxin domain-containing protein [Myxococcota bacterium]
MPGSLHDFSQKTIDGTQQSLADYEGKVLLVVNVASRCGLTPQYAGMQALHDEYRARGFSVLGFPCNQFAGQEPGSEAEIKTFCSTKYGVTFPLFAKLDVNGAGRAPLYAWLTSQATKPDGAGDIA